MTYDNGVFDSYGNEIGVVGCRTVGNNDIVLVRLMQPFSKESPHFVGVEWEEVMPGNNTVGRYVLSPEPVALDDLDSSLVNDTHYILEELSRTLGVRLECRARVYRSERRESKRRGDDAYTFELWADGAMVARTARAMHAAWEAIGKYGRRKPLRVVALSYPRREPDSEWPEERPQVVEVLSVSRKGGVSLLCADPFGKHRFRMPVAHVDWWGTLGFPEWPRREEILVEQLREERSLAELEAFSAFLDRNEPFLDYGRGTWDDHVREATRYASD